MAIDAPTSGLREKAVQLRLAGHSRSQIADALGLGSGGQPLSRWLQGVPPPAWTRRPRAKDDLRAQAVAMRAEGRSYREIQEVVGVAKSTLSLWLRDVPLTDEQRRALELRGPEATRKNAQAARANAIRRRQRIQTEARNQITQLSESELFVAGVVAYWAEGTKNKPWRSGAKVRFSNSDPSFIGLFIRWLHLVGVTDDRIYFRLQIHESAEVGDAWSSGAEPSTSIRAGSSTRSSRLTTRRRSAGTSATSTTVVSASRCAVARCSICRSKAGVRAWPRRARAHRAVGSLQGRSGVVQRQDIGFWHRQWRFDPSLPSQAVHL